MREFFLHGGQTLKVISADTQLPVPGAVASIHAMLVQAGGKEDK